ncbi:acetyltransferase [Vibrio natriegens]|uniref:Acetyltransferase n=1 Tax=Vibrio natriegens NBRC 15636 = ATCC 14048 = DSM 759 TaxID=1219067 RepID=A0AAN1CWH2_VIBNA|nr:acetyltransferase [Vibrio natriegens]ALR17071.1 acetyltransferase [Vibrio natriegens NBRC 15636 = ATCC 14048 = DSM 759]ANQ13732.1 acetyltransferase [Vibrio natriegens NBRC 15636 = ATCC 14048 = DSM 759]EPM38610.1 acetyltransferase [Vibrio natriegens NBRC 15636 = ATCC 14048 = DSM 759]MDX6028179.1 DHH family phosphoesterase [Vibrio natriegens NBRC 15636 = ATCC 14048 = DSM 759]UUI11471.1 DHH family phosphoesterase [Vibrio natriegens]
MNYDIFNGDADGIIALLQLRLADPLEAKLVTGVKRGIKLVETVDVQAGDELTVLDVSMEKNMAGLEHALAQGAHVFYADHHKAGDIPQHGNLDAHIDLDANMCTALIVDKLLQGRFHAWAITAAYGDNLIAKADELADLAGFSAEQKAQLKELGTLINYNGYGSKVDDLHFHPADLYQALMKYTSPFDVIADASSPFYLLQSAYQQDMDAAQAIPATHESNKLKLFELPDNAASRRISGVYGNWLANQNPDSAHAVLTENVDGTYTVSLRAPLNNKQGAVAVCGQFPTGGGREAAAGINALSKDDVSAFIDAVETYYA